MVNTTDGAIPVDTGFIVFNDRNYPLLTKLFNHLDVPITKSNMSFGVSINDGWLEYGTEGLANLVTQKRNLFRLEFLKMMADILRFNTQAKDYLNRDPSITLGQCLEELKMGDWFRDYYLLAMGGAIWSTPLIQMLNFPARTFIQFFENHGLLTVNDHPQWYTVVGGSKEYIKRLIEPFQQKIRTNCGVESILRQTDYVEIIDSNGNTETYDQVIVACHSDQVLDLIEQPTKNETDIISKVQYQPNEMVLHSDTNFMPKRKSAWASWVYLSKENKDQNPSISLSYWMNNLQPLDTDQPMIVTLNPGSEPDPSLVHDRYLFDHPVFDTPAINSQSRLEEIQGENRTWFAGAWQRYGFHEDGLLSAVRIVEKMGVPLPWN